jgi:hypothetical protein
MAKNTDQQNTSTDSRAGVFFGSAGLAKVIGVAVFIWRRPLEKFLFSGRNFFSRISQKSIKPNKNHQNFHFGMNRDMRMDSRFSDCSSVSPTHLEDSKVLTASETRKKSTYGVNPIFEFLFARLSKYVSETESHAILNGIQDEIRFAAPPEYTENDETISIGTLDVDASPPYIHPSDCKQNVDHAEAKTASDANDNRRPKRKFVEGQEMLTTTKKQQVEDSGTDYGVVAIKFLDPDFRAGGISQFSRLKGQNSLHRFTNLRAQTRGVYVVEDEGHVITWNCDTQTILDSDPRYPHPLPINDENLKLLLQRPRIELAYRVHTCKKIVIN